MGPVCLISQENSVAQPSSQRGSKPGEAPRSAEVEVGTHLEA